GLCCYFFFNDTATTEIYTLSLHDALPISGPSRFRTRLLPRPGLRAFLRCRDRKSTRLNSSHISISYAVFCLKKKKARRIQLRHALVVLSVHTFKYADESLLTYTTSWHF